MPSDPKKRNLFQNHLSTALLMLTLIAFTTLVVAVVCEWPIHRHSSRKKDV